MQGLLQAKRLILDEDEGYVESKRTMNEFQDDKGATMDM